MDAERDRQLAELRAAATRRPGPAAPREPVLTREDSLVDWCQARGIFDQADQPLSFDRYLRGLATARWDDAPAERALAEATVGAGGALVPAPLSSRVIDLARNRTVVFRAGAQTVPMTSQTLALARLTSEGSPAWKTENAAITAADMVFDRVTFTARTLVRLITLSVELFEDADPSSEDVIARSFAGQMAVELDRVALLGTGTAPEPRGILNQSGVTLTAHGANGTAITNYDWWLDAIGTVRAAGFEPKRARPSAAQLDQPEQAQRGHDERLHGAAGRAAANVHYEIGSDYRHHRHVDRHQLCFYRRLVEPHGRNSHQFQPEISRRAVPGR
jgi:HK97 family phage major capsid protein